MDLASYKNKLGLKEPEAVTETKIRSEKRYLTIIQYIRAKNSKKIYKYIGTHAKAVKDIKESFELAKKDILNKCQNSHSNGALSIIVVEQTWATVKTNHDILSTNEFSFQPISSRWLTWEEIQAALTN